MILPVWDGWLGRTLLSDSTKPLPEPIFTHHILSPVTSIGKHFTGVTSAINQSLQIYSSKIQFNSFSRGQWVKLLTLPGISYSRCFPWFRVNLLMFRNNGNWSPMSSHYPKCLFCILTESSPTLWPWAWFHKWLIVRKIHHHECRADSRLAPSQWETSLQSNAVSHWLGANLESALWVWPVPARTVVTVKKGTVKKKKKKDSGYSGRQRAPFTNMV